MTAKGFTFGDEPPPEVSAYLRQKGDRPAFRHTEVWGEEHAYAFTVAKAVQTDILGTLREAVQYASDKGIPYEAWARDLKPELQRLGWWGPVAMADPATGEVKDRELGSPRRLRTIYDANLRSARAAGQWERGQRTKGVLPYWLYCLGPSANHRPEHAAKEGIVRPVDDGFWDAWFCPNGWGCKCYQRQITKAEASRRGVSPPPDIPMTVFKRTRDDGSIERVHVPVGIDPGWQTNPGKNRAQTLMTNMSDRFARAGGPAARALMSDLWKGSTPEALAKLARPVSAPVAVAPDHLREQLASKASLVMVKTDMVAAEVETHAKGPRPLTPADFGRVQRILDKGQMVDHGDGRATYVFDDDGWFQAEVRTSDAGDLVLRSLAAIEADRARALIDQAR